jgi:hypothetical protein
VVGGRSGYRLFPFISPFIKLNREQRLFMMAPVIGFTACSITGMRNLDVAKAHAVIEKLIPKNAVVSAHQQAVPHLAFRDTIYLFPEIRNAQYIVLLNEQVPYPLTPQQLLEEEKKLRASKEWRILYDARELTDI